MTDQNQTELDDMAATLAAEVQESKENNKRGGGGGRNPLVGVGLLLCGVAFAAFMFWPKADPEAAAPILTASPEQFQTTSDAPFGNLSIPQRQAQPPAEPDPVLLQQVSDLQAEIDRLRAEQSAAPSVEPEAAPVEDTSASVSAVEGQIAELQDRLDKMASDSAERLAERERENAQLQAQLDAARIMGGGSGSPDLGMDDAEQRRLDAEELYRTRASSPMIAFGSGTSGGGGSSASDAATDALGGIPGLEGIDPNQRRQSGNEQFARQQATRAAQERAQVIANPGNTITQGTMIQAVLETAINTDLPGAIRALVSEDVHAIDGSRILIPRGSRVIGAYNDQTSLGQRRAMIVWNRIILPDAQTVEIGAYGGDAIGRAGVDGRVNTHFGPRFGSAALISLIGLAPALALSDSDSDSNASDLAEAVSRTMSGTMANTLGGYLNRQPTITVNPGSMVTIMVDRDLEIF